MLDNSASISESISIGISTEYNADTRSGDSTLHEKKADILKAIGDGSKPAGTIAHSVLSIMIPEYTAAIHELMVLVLSRVATLNAREENDEE